MHLGWLAQTEEPADVGDLPADAYRLPVYLSYVLYPPLYIAGPVLTFDGFAAQLLKPRPPPLWQACPFGPWNKYPVHVCQAWTECANPHAIRDSSTGPPIPYLLNGQRRPASDASVQDLRATEWLAVRPICHFVAGSGAAIGPREVSVHSQRRSSHTQRGGQRRCCFWR
jgi:hypothetical protein